MNSSNDMNQFSIEKARSGTKEFFESNSLVAKVAFLLLILIVFVILLRLCVSIITWYYTPGGNPHFLDGMQQANQMRRFIQDPNDKGAKTIVRSRNEDAGIEFTWSVWIYIDDISSGSGKYRHIFHKGDNPSHIDSTGMVYPNNAPGLYLAPNTNSLYVVMNTFHDYKEEVMIPNIPLQKWVSVIIRCKNTTLDAYVNGVISQSISLTGVPKQNYGDVWLCANGGFSGFVSNLWYYDYALGASEIASLNQKGPDRTMVGQTGIEHKKPDYLSLRWYFFGNENMYNP